MQIAAKLVLLSSQEMETAFYSLHNSQRGQKDAAL